MSWIQYCSRLFPPNQLSGLELDFLRQEEEHFIPIRLELILERILDDPTLESNEKNDFRMLTQMFLEHYHYDYHQEYLRLKECFTPFNPDPESVYEVTFSEEEKRDFRVQLVEGIGHFLEVSNYRQLSEDEFNECLKLQPFGGLAIEVNTEMFESFQVYYRGIRDVPRTEKWGYFFEKYREIRELKRVFVLARYREEIHDGKIIAKLFRDVAVENLKIVAPEVRLLMPLFDKMKIGGTTLAGIATAGFKFLTSLVVNPWVAMVIFGTFVMALMKGVLGFFNIRTRYLQLFSSSLYHNTLANNLGAVHMLVDQAETQEVKEALLAYYLLYRGQKEGIHRTMEELDGAVEAWLLKHFGYPIDFEVDDALRKLREKKLVTVLPSENSQEVLYQVYSLPATLRRLDEIWDNLHVYHNEHSAEDNLFNDNIDKKRVFCREM